MSLSDDFLDHAIKLIRPLEPNPGSISLRRIVSSLYYALFHQITEEAAALIGRNVSLEIIYRIQRWFEHATMKQICGRFLKPRLEQPLNSQIGNSASPDLQIVCKTFISLQDARHDADYDPAYVINLNDALQHFESALEAIQAWRRIRDTSEANVFILSLLLFRNWERER